jgi:tetratricopeptide (TPR) repeat protein
MKKIARIIPYLFVFGLLIFFQATLYGQTEDELLKEIVATANAGKNKKAIKLCDKLIARNPKCSQAYIDKYFIYRNMGEVIEALGTLNQGLEKNPSDALLYQERGKFFQICDNFEFAMRDFNQGIKFAENDTIRNEIMFSKGTVLMQTRDFKGAYDILIGCFSFDSTNFSTLNNLAVTCMDLDKPELTLYYLLKVISVDSLYTSGYLNLGFHYQKLGDHKRSIEYFDKTIELDPDHPLAYNNRGYGKLMLGDLQGALKDVNNSLELFPTNAYAFRNRALIYLEMGQKNKACEDLQRAIELGFTLKYGNEVRDLIGRNC